MPPMPWVGCNNGCKYDTIMHLRQHVMDLNFELFEEGEVGRSRDRVHVTLGKDHHIYFSRKAVEALGGCEGVALMFDRRRQVIGVMPAEVGRKHSYRLRKSKISGAGRRINAKN